MRRATTEIALNDNQEADLLESALRTAFTTARVSTAFKTIALSEVLVATVWLGSSARPNNRVMAAVGSFTSGALAAIRILRGKGIPQ